MMVEAAPKMDGVLWGAVRQIVAAMQAFLIPDNPGTAQEFLATTIETATSPDVAGALEGRSDAIEAVAMRTIAEAVEAYLTRRIGRETLIGTTISAVDKPAIAIALYGRQSEETETHNPR
jgi:hypothetical protein